MTVVIKQTFCLKRGSTPSWRRQASWITSILSMQVDKPQTLCLKRSSTPSPSFMGRTCVSNCPSTSSWWPVSPPRDLGTHRKKQHSYTGTLLVATLSTERLLGATDTEVNPTHHVTNGALRPSLISSNHASSGRLSFCSGGSRRCSIWTGGRERGESVARRRHKGGRGCSHQKRYPSCGDSARSSRILASNIAFMLRLPIWPQVRKPSDRRSTSSSSSPTWARRFQRACKCDSRHRPIQEPSVDKQGALTLRAGTDALTKVREKS